MHTTLDQATEVHDQALFQKTPLGMQEIKARAYRLSPRTRQLLIVIDGQRQFSDLLRVAPREELLEHLNVLLQNGLVERLDTVEYFAPPSSGTTLAPPTFSPTQAQAVPFEPTMTIEAARQRLSRALIDTMGPHGEGLAARIERASDFQELRELLTTIAPVVEAFGGRTALQGFVQRVGKIF